MTSTSTSTGTALPAGLVPGTYAIDPAHSEVGFVARHAMVTKVRGRFTEVEGTLTFGETLEQSGATATMKVASVSTGNADRDGHLKGPDFFDAATHPDITFSTTGVRADGDQFLLTGDLTIKGTTRPVTLPVEFEGVATDSYGNQRAGFSASTDIDRGDWGLGWNVVLETGGVMVSKKIQLQLDISAIKQA